MRLGQTSVVHFASQVVASLAGFAATVYLARLLGPDVLGTYFLFVAVLIWLKIAGSNGIRVALIKRLSETGDEGGYLTAGIVLQVVVLAAIGLLLAVFRGSINSYVGFDATVPLFALLMVTVAFSFVTAAIEGTHRVHIASLLQPIDRSLRSLFQIAAAAMGLGLLGLLAGYGVALATAGLVGLLFVTIRPSMPERREFDQLGSFAGYSWLTGIEARSFSSMDTIILGFFVANGLIGVYEVAWNLASILAVFGTSISQSLFPALSDRSSRDESSAVASLTNDALAYSGLIIIPGLVGSAVVGRSVLAIYGPEFEKGYVVLVVLVAARLVYVYESQFTNVLNAIDRPEAALRVSVAFIGTNLALNVLLVSSYGWIGAAVATGLSAVLALALGYWYLARYVTFTVPFTEIGRQVLAAVVMGGGVYAGTVVFGHGVVPALVLVPLGGGVYFAVLYGLSGRFRETVRNNVPVHLP